MVLRKFAFGGPVYRYVCQDSKARSRVRFSNFFDKLREVKFYVGQFDFVEQDVLPRQYFSVIQRSVLFYNRAYRLTTTLRTVYLIL